MKKILFILPLIVVFWFSCDQLTPTENHDPYPLVSPESIVITSGDATQTVRLMCSENPDGAYLYDEDGDTVTVVLDPETPLPDCMTLNEETGVLVIYRTCDDSGTLRFWTIDDNGGSTEDQPLEVSYTISSAGNTAPTASFATWDYEISGAEAGLENVNGNYTETQVTSYSKVVYANSSGYSLFFCLIKDVKYIWAIDYITVSSDYETASTDTLTYYVNSLAEYPPEDGWLTGSDVATSLTVKGVPFHGDTSDWGNTLTASYIFADADGHSEGTSIYRWLRNSLASPDLYTEINGANEISYTTVETDDGLRLKFEVTPVDAYGMSGTPVLSEASKVIGST